MSKNIQVKLTFSSDTRAAQQQLNQLQQTLSNIAATPITGSGLKTAAADIQAATSKALELKVALQNATNVNTGKLNFNKFNQELKKNKTTLKEYAMQLQRLGPEGVQAFSQLAQSIRTAETPLVSMQGKLAALGQTFMNTVKWSISSSMIQGVTRAFTSTIDYAKDLNESLNNIRIVTGKSVDDVSKFAVQANKAAKALSATTDEYAKASLIYFQQGLEDSEVEERTNTTLKLAKVVGESAETTSEWMTAIWNNFDDGSRSLENYADVLAKLGAATASSADEIAGGLEKFAAVSETVGLSYEYAASALATITAETRQSEDVVGTALKTIFARVENLSLGETLEDGTTLGKYSEALAKVGVNIKDSNGNLKEMDDILDSIGMQWQILGKDQQVALAQSVAGIRQYNQFMALMDNWDVMEKNVELAREANGALEDQHEIWETGIEGATSRVKEELNEIKNSLLGENDLLPMLNMAEGFLDFLGDLVDSLGGLPGLLSIIASVGLKIWGPQVAAGLTNMVNGIKSLYGVASGKSQAAQSAMAQDASELERGMVANVGSGQRGMVDSTIAEKEANLTSLILQNEKNISADKKQQIEFARQLLKIEEERLQKIADEHDAAQSGADKARRKLEAMDVDNEDVDRLETAAKLNGRATAFDTMAVAEDGSNIDAIRKEAAALSESVNITGPGAASAEEIAAIAEARTEVNTATNHYTKGLEKLNKEEGKLAQMSGKLTKEEQKTNKAFQEQKQRVADAKNNLSKYGKEVNSAKSKLAQTVKATKQYSKTLNDLKDKYDDASDALEDFGDNTREADQKNMELKEGQDNLGKSFEETGEKVHKAAAEGQGWTTSFVGAMQGVASAAAGVQMMIGAVDSLSSAIADGSAGFSDYLSAITSVLFALPMMVNGLKSVGDMLHFNTIKTKALDLITKIFSKTEKKKADEAMGNANKEIAANTAEDASDMADIGTDIAQQAAEGPKGWVTAAISAALVAALIGGAMLMAQPKKTAAQEEEQRTEDIENAEKTLETAGEWKEKNEALDETADKYEELSKKINRTAEEEKELLQLQNNITEQMPELIEKYEELAKTLDKTTEWSGDIQNIKNALAAGDIDKAIELEEELETKANKAVSESAAKGATAQTYKVAATMDELQGKIKKDGTYKARVGGKGNYVENLVKNSSILEGDDQYIRLDTTNTDNFVKQYKELQRIAQEAEKAGKTGDDAYREIQELLSASKEEYEKLEQLRSDGLSYSLEAFAQEKGIIIDNIKSYEDYDRQKKEFVQQVVNAGKATEEEAAAFFEGQKAISAYATAEKKLGYIKEQYGATTAKQVEDFYRSIKDPEKAKLFLQIDFSKFTSEQALEDQLEILQKTADANEIEVKLKASENAMGMLKKNMTADDWTKLQTDSGISWGENGIVQFSEFINASYEQQSAYLLQLQEESYASFMKTNEEKLELLMESLAAMEALEESERGENWGVEVAGLKAQIEQTKILIGARKSAKAAEQKTKNEAKKKALDDIERYHAEKQALEDLERQLNRITTAKDRAFGSAKLSLMNQETEKIKEQIAAQKDLATKLEASVKSDRQAINNFGFSTDASGNIIDYEKTMQDNINKWYASLSKEDADDKVSEIKKAVSQYEESLQELQDTQDEVINKQNELADLALEKIEFKVSMQIDIAEDEKAYLEFLMQEIEDDAFAAADAIGNMTKQLKPLETQIKATEEGIASIMADIETNRGVMTDTQAEKLREYRDNLIDYNAELLELRTTVQDKLTEAYDAWNEKLDENASAIEHYGSVIEHYKNIIDIVGKDDLGISDETLNQMRRAQVSNANDAVKASKAALDANQAYLDDLRQKRAAAAAEYGEDSIEVKEWDEQIKTAEEKVREATETFNGNWANALQVAADAFQDSVTQIVETFSESVSGIYKNLEELQEAFDRQVEVNDRYLAQYEKTYEISKLNRQISDSIDKTDNVGSQKELRDLQKQLLAMNKEGVEVSQRDIEFMQKKYDLMLAEQGLKDAQNAKSVVRLQRDSEGNFGYVYTADQGNVDKAQQNYEEKLYQMQKFGDESLMEVQEQIIATNQEFADALQAIAENANLSMEEKKAKQEEITAYYTEKLKYWTDEANKFMLNSQEINGKYNAAMADSFNKTLLGQMYPDLTTFEDYYEQSMTAMTTAGNNFVETVETKGKDYETAMANAGTSTDNFENTVKTELEKAQKESSDTATATQNMAKKISEELAKATGSVKTFQEDYSKKFATVRSENEATITSINSLISKYNELSNAKNNASNGNDGSSTGGPIGGTKGIIPNGSISNDAGQTSYQYHISNPTTTEEKAADNSGFATLKDNAGNIMGYAYKNNLTPNANGDKANLTSGKLYQQLIFDGNGKVKEALEVSNDKWTTYTMGGSDLDVKICDFDETYSMDGNQKQQTENLKAAMKQRAGYIMRDGKKYYAFKFEEGDKKDGKWYFAELDSFIDDYKWNKTRDPQLNNRSPYYSFDTGGYTGEWGPEGRLAMLHQKEIVLNAHDTENFLAAIGIVRDISDQIEKNAIVMQYQNQLANYKASISNGGETLQQEVHITAEFPNAIDHNEIEEAFKNLTNLASQYANRK